ncbi:MAG: alpha/beta hydrolase [Deltaproteobacteria bacterium]|nr:MAG: alpha/beta hydrolase [Deltaproteobacteria bacterium]
MRDRPFSLATVDQMQINVHGWLPDDDVGAVLIIAHGMAEHGGRYRRLAEALTAQGYAVYAPDHRGHGLTARTVQDLGFFAEEGGFAKVVSDLRALTEHVRAEHPGCPLVLLGHSMGSYLTQAYLMEHDDLAGAAMTGSSLNTGLLPALGRKIARIERIRRGPRRSSWLLTRLSFGAFARTIPKRRTDYDWLSRDPAEVDTYIEDPLCGFSATTQLWIDLLDSFPRLADPSRVARIRADLPLWIASGSEDPVHDGGKGFDALRDLYVGRGFTDAQFTLYDGARHELFNETNREEVTADLLAWLHRVTGMGGTSEE